MGEGGEFKASKGRTERLEALEEAQNILASETDPEAILRKLAMVAARLIDAETLSVTMLSDDGRLVRYEYATGRHAGALLGKVLPIENAGLCGWVLENHKPILSVDLLKDPRVIKEAAVELGIHTALLTPLIAKGEIIGGLSAFNKLGGSKFNDDDLAILSQLSGYAALAVVNARLMRDLAREKTKAEVVLDNIGDGLVFISGDGEITEINRATHRLTMTDGEDLLGRRVRDIDPADPLYKAIDWEAMAEPGKRCWEVLSCADEACPVHKTGALRCWLHSDGHCLKQGGEGCEKLWDVCSGCEVMKQASLRLGMRREVKSGETTLQVSSVLVMEKDKNDTFGELLVIHDVSSEKQLDSQRSDFISMLSHDLKTPISSIMGYSELIDQEEDITTIMELNRVVSSNSARLLKMINDMLEFSRVESGQLEPDMSDIGIRPLMATLLEPLSPIARDRGVGLTWDVDGDAPDVHADIDFMSRIMGNLVGNAIEHAGKGGNVHVRASNGPEGFAGVEVKDDGPGIDPEHLPRIFDKYYSVNKGARGNRGLGLAIVKALCEAQGGRVSVESEKGRGTAFRVFLPEAK